MKLLAIRFVLITIFLIVSFSSKAYDFINNDIAYSITSFTDFECEVVSRDEPYEGCVKIPNFVEFQGKELKVVAIGNMAFKDNTNLSEIILGENIITIEEESFRGCISLKGIGFSQNLQTIGKYSFADCISIESIELPELVNTILEGAFYNCSSLKNVSLPATLKKLGEGSFSNCVNLNSINLENLENIGASSFENCEKYYDIKFGKSLLSIGSRAFKNCISFNSLCLPESLKQIGEESFANTQIFNFYIPDNVTHIGKNAIKDCENIHVINIGPGINEIEGTSLWGCCELDSLIIREGNNELTLIGDGTMFSSNIPYYTEIKESIGAFTNLNVKYVELDRDIKYQSYYHYSFGSYSEGGNSYYSPFSKNKYIETLVIGGKFVIDSDRITYVSGGGSPIYSYQFVRHWKFNDCINLKTIVFESQDKTIPSSCFSNCKNIILLNSGNITEIKEDAFSGCDNLISLILPKVQTIGKNAFLACPIETCFLSNSIQNLNNSLSNCPLQRIEIEKKNPPQAEEFLKETYLNCILKIPFNSDKNYKEVSPWNNFWNLEEFSEIKAEEIILSNNNLKLIVGETERLKAEIYPIDTSITDITWMSSDSEVANVSENGEVTGNSKGKATIKATCGEVSAICEIIVLEQVGFKEEYSTVSYDDMSVSTTKDYFNYIPEITGPYNEDDFWMELWVLDKDNKYDQHVITISGGDYAGNYINTNTDREMWTGKYIFNLISKGTNPYVTANPSRAYVTVNRASTNLEWNVSSPINVKVGEKVDLGISYQADLWCTFNTDYDKELISISSDGATGRNPHWYVTGLNEGVTTLYFSIECLKNDFGFYDFSDSSTLYKEIIVSGYYEDGIDDVSNDSAAFIIVYNLQGVRMNVSTRDELHNLAPGIYIINGKKEIIR